jgi:hypothetical protein
MFSSYRTASAWRRILRSFARDQGTELSRALRRLSCWMLCEPVAVEAARMLKRTLSLILVLAVMLPAADLPVREVTLYKHGVAFFGRAGELKPGETAQLNFKADEMNDVLKSLTITDRSGGKVYSVRYDSNEPLARKLSDFPFTVGPESALATFLDSVKGALVELKLGADTVRGTVLSARVAREVDNDRATQRELLVLLTDSGEIRTFDLAAASAVKFVDAKLQTQLRDYLQVLNQARSKDRRSVYIDASGAGTRQITASYMIPSPIWKSSYRLMLSAQGEPTLEGWAIVDNTTGDNWTNVRLSLVSGKPVSFISNLYDPRYISRPVADLAENQAVAPVVDTGAVTERDEKAAAMARQAPSPAPPAFMGGRLGAAAEVVATAAGIPSSIAATAAAREAGELFEYSFSSPVTVKQGESAMLPFLQQKITARKLLVYSESYGLNPRDAAEITNNTGKTLDGGPITVYDSGAYAGEALVETLPMGDRRLISYGVDLGTRITTAFDSSRAVVREVHAKRGVVTTKSAISETKTYTIKNVDAKAKVLILEHPQRPGYNLLERKPLETTSDAYRFEVKLPASASETYPVKEERVFDQTIAVANITPDLIATWIQNKAVSEAARKQLEQIAAKKSDVAANEGALRQVDADLNSLAQDQARIRSNIESLNRVSGQQDQVQQYARQLATTEARLAALRDSQSDLRKKKAALETELNDLLNRLDF